MLRQISTGFMGEMFLYARAMENRSGVHIVRTGSQIERITAEKLGGAFGKWTTFALGQFAFHILVLRKFSGFTTFGSLLQARFPARECLTMHCNYRVGGVVSETSFKFFVQFVAWAAILCIFTLIVLAIVISEHKKEVGHLYLFFCLHPFLLPRVIVSTADHLI